MMQDRAAGRVLRRVAVFVGLLGAIGSGASFAVEPTEEGGRVSHEAWDGILREHVGDEGWVDYEGLRRESLGELDAYLRMIGAVDFKKLDRDEQIALWRNAYNALCIRILIDQGLPDTVPRRSFLGIGTNIFKIEKYRIAGRKRSLDDIEHGILRKRYDEPRIHAALVCGASSCPRLRPEAYTAAKLDRQLDEECRRWIREGRDLKGRRKNRLDREKKTFYASMIFSWFRKDFGGTEEGVLEFVRRFADEEDAAFLRRHAGEVRVSYLDYDWSLNAAP